MGPAVEPQAREAPVWSKVAGLDLDVHARTTLAGVIAEASGELSLQRVSPRSEETVAWLETLPRPVRVAHEAGPTGSGLARACERVGPRRSRVPRAIASRPTAATPSAWRGSCAWALVPVRVPDPVEEAARDLVRAREDGRGDLMRARHRLSKLLLRHGLVYEGAAWTFAHDAWLRRQRFSSQPLALAFDDCYGTILQARGRRDSRDRAIAELAGEAPFADVVSRLVCLRGVSTLTALALTVEPGDWERFRPQSLGPFLGLVRREDSTGERRRQHAIPKTGNTHARRLLVEAAWHPATAATRERRARAAPAGPARGRPRTRRRERTPAAHTLACTRGEGQSGGGSSPSRSPASSPATAGGWATMR
jgi:transposase